MKQPANIRPIIIGGTSVVVGIYLSLAFVALFCVTAHSANHGQAAHSSPLCSWACQANNTASLITLMSPVLPILLFIAILTSSLCESPTPQQARFSSRSPPR